MKCTCNKLHAGWSVSSAQKCKMLLQKGQKKFWLEEEQMFCTFKRNRFVLKDSKHNFFFPPGTQLQAV